MHGQNCHSDESNLKYIDTEPDFQLFCCQTDFTCEGGKVADKNRCSLFVRPTNYSYLMCMKCHKVWCLLAISRRKCLGGWFQPPSPPVESVVLEAGCNRIDIPFTWYNNYVSLHVHCVCKQCFLPASNIFFFERALSNFFNWILLPCLLSWLL